jgi:hypothetical protein
MRVNNTRMDISSITHFYWKPMLPPMMGRRQHYLGDEFGMSGHFLDKDRNSDTYFMLRGRRVYWCPIEKQWKDIRANQAIFSEMTRYDCDAVINLVVDTTHNAVHRIQRWWRQQFKRFNLSKMLVFHSGIHNLNGDTMYLIAQLLVAH